MRKEVLYAIIAGISIGLVVAFGTWKISSLAKVTPLPIAKRTDAPVQKKIDSTSVSSHNNYDVVTENPTIQGISEPNKDIIISTEIKDYYVKSNNDGDFQAQIELPAGLSEIKIDETKLQLVYSTETDPGQTAIVGSITDIASESIQMKSEKGEIKQVTVTTDTTYVNNIKQNTSVKLTDLAIGDYVIAIGTISSNKVLETKRIIITSPPVETQIIVEKITIEKMSKTTINDITLPKKWNGPNIKELEVGDIIFMVKIVNKDKTHTLRSLFKRVS